MSSLTFAPYELCRHTKRTGVIWVTVLLAFSMIFMSSGCRNPEVVWSSEIKSPDGKMIASARAFANEGFGVSGAPGTFVYLNWSTGSQKPKEILELSEDIAGANTQSVELHWASSRHLEVFFQNDKQEIQFQAVRFGDVEITVKASIANVLPPSS